MIEIRTKDADEAAFYWVQPSVELNRVETTDGYKKKTLWFIFDANMSEDELNKLRTDYRNGKCLVEPKSYAGRRLEVKNLIRENIFS